MTWERFSMWLRICGCGKMSSQGAVGGSAFDLDPKSGLVLNT